MVRLNSREISHKTRAMISHHHNHALLPNQCSSSVVQVMEAPLHLVWALIRQFSKPQAYKQFIKSCELVTGDGEAEGSVREVTVVSGLPAGRSMERLERLDDEMHVTAFSIIGGDHRLSNYHSTTTVHVEEEEEEEINGHERNRKETVVIESYVVDVPSDNSREDTCSFAETIIGCNLRSLASVSETMAVKRN